MSRGPLTSNEEGLGSGGSNMGELLTGKRGVVQGKDFLQPLSAKHEGRTEEGMETRGKDRVAIGPGGSSKPREKPMNATPWKRTSSKRKPSSDSSSKEKQVYPSERKKRSGKYPADGHGYKCFDLEARSNCGKEKKVNEQWGGVRHGSTIGPPKWEIATIKKKKGKNQKKKTVTAISEEREGTWGGKKKGGLGTTG